MNAEMLADITQDLAELTAIRRDIHAHPELGLEEVRTAALVAAKLREWGVEVTEGVGVTGVVGVIRGTSHFVYKRPSMCRLCQRNNPKRYSQCICSSPIW